MPKNERQFKYQRRDASSVRERANMRGGDFDSFTKSSTKIYKVRDGKNLIRILPPTWDDARHYGYDIWINYGIGADNQSYLSLSKMKGEPDPIADAKRVAEREGDKKLADALKPRQRIGIWVIDRMAEEEGPQFWPAPFSFDKDLANLCMDEDSGEVLMIDDPVDGRDVRFYKEGQGLKTKYDPTKIKVLQPSPLSEDERLENSWLEYVQDHPVPSVLNYYSYDHIASVFDGQARVDRDDDEDEKPVRKPVSKAPPFDPDDEPSPRKRVTREQSYEDEDEERNVESAPLRKAPPKAREEASEEDEEVPVTTSSIAERLRARRASTESTESAATPRARSTAREDADPDEDEQPFRRRRVG
jgi:hypothetical protein